jgi:hypothetical protein
MTETETAFCVRYGIGCNYYLLFSDRDNNQGMNRKELSLADCFVSAFQQSLLPRAHTFISIYTLMICRRKEGIIQWFRD